jgi:sec-independent protein translocase protein TatA
MFSNIGTTEILVIVLVLVVLFGGNKISEVARGLGEATKEIKKAKKAVESTKEELKKDVDIDEEVVVTPTLPPKKKSKHLKKNKK